MERDALLVLCRHAANFEPHFELVQATVEMFARRNGYPNVASYLDFHKLGFLSDWVGNGCTLQQLVRVQAGSLAACVGTHSLISGSGGTTWHFSRTHQPGTSSRAGEAVAVVTVGTHVCAVYGHRSSMILGIACAMRLPLGLSS